jgi:hypothetical protein
MAIRRYLKASDNSPAYGHAIVDDIQGTGEFQLPIEWTRAPQDGIVTFAQSFNLPPEFVPYSGGILRTLSQTGMTTVYDIQETVAAATATTIGGCDYASVIHPTLMETIKQGAWNLTTSVAGAADQITLTMEEFVAEDPLYAIVHQDGEVQGNLTYFGTGTDVSSSYGLGPGYRWSVPTSLTSDDDIAEMVFVDGIQIIGDIYDYYQHYGGGAYDMFQMDDGTVEFLLVDPVLGATTLFFAIFIRVPEPRINIRYEDPFDEDGVWIEYFSIPKGDMVISYYIT